MKSTEMKKLTRVHKETMDFCIRQIEEARRQTLDMSKANKGGPVAQSIIDARNGIVYTQGGNCTIRTLRALEKKGLIEVLEDNSGIGTAAGAFPSKIKVIGFE